jgi:hypothetical protein
VRLSPLGTSATVGLLYQPRMIDDDDYGALGGMRIGRGNRSTRRKPASVPLCPPQIPHDLTCDLTRDAAVRSQRLTAWAMARPWSWCNYRYVMNNLKIFQTFLSRNVNRDSAIGIATGDGLDDCRVGVRVTEGVRFFSSTRRPDRFRGPPSLLSNGYRGHFPRG